MSYTEVDSPEPNWPWKLMLQCFAVGGIGIVLLVIMFICAATCHGEDMKFVKYEEVTDCPFPSTRTEVVDEHGNVSYVVKMDSRCR